MATYKESLRSGGELVVNENNWHIEYYFPGIDLRYNGSLVIIPSNKINLYIDAYKKNFQTYLKVKDSIPQGDYQTTGEMNMQIRIGWNEGVCIKAYYMPINTKEKLDTLLSDYKYAIEKSQKVMFMLKQLENN